MADDSLIDQLARARGLGDAYHDYRGELNWFSRETKAAILAAMGCDVGNDAAIRRELEAIESSRWATLLPPVAIVRNAPHEVPVNVAQVKPIYKAGGRWNTFEVYAKGDQITVKMNGDVTVSTRANTSSQGRIGLQYNAGPIKVRKLLVREL